MSYSWGADPDPRPPAGYVARFDAPLFDPPEPMPEPEPEPEPEPGTRTRAMPPVPPPAWPFQQVPPARPRVDYPPHPRPPLPAVLAGEWRAANPSLRPAPTYVPEQRPPVDPFALPVPDYSDPAADHPDARVALGRAAHRALEARDRAADAAAAVDNARRVVDRTELKVDELNGWQHGHAGRLDAIERQLGAVEAAVDKLAAALEATLTAAGVDPSTVELEAAPMDLDGLAGRIVAQLVARAAGQ